MEPKDCAYEQLCRLRRISEAVNKIERVWASVAVLPIAVTFLLLAFVTMDVSMLMAVAAVLVPLGFFVAIGWLLARKIEEAKRHIEEIGSGAEER